MRSEWWCCRRCVLLVLLLQSVLVAVVHQSLVQPSSCSRHHTVDTAADRAEQHQTPRRQSYDNCFPFTVYFVNSREHVYDQRFVGL